MSKTIDVGKADRFEYKSMLRVETGMYQYRNGKCRMVDPDGADEWFDDDDTDDEYRVNTPLALAYLGDWGYTLTAAKDEAPAKTEPTLDVPKVGDIWVEHDGVLSGYSQWNKMHALHGYEIRNGTARIVRLAPDADLAATVKRVEERVAKLEAATTAEVRHVRSEMIVGGDCTRAKVRVVAPMPIASPASSYGNGYNDAIADFTKVLSAARIDVVKEAGK